MHKVAQLCFSFRSVFYKFSADGPELENWQKTMSFLQVFQNAMSSFLQVFTFTAFYKFSSIATSSRQPSKQEHAKEVQAKRCKRTRIPATWVCKRIETNTKCTAKQAKAEATQSVQVESQ